MEVGRYCKSSAGQAAQIVDDVWIASHPGTPDGGRYTWHGVRPAVGYGWWSTWLLGLLFNGISFRMIRNDDSLEAWRNSYLADTVAAFLLAAAAVQLAYIVHKIGQFQEARRLALPGPERTS